MGLSAEQKEWLEARYEYWGLDRVREELQRPERDMFSDPDVTALARAWVEAKEAGARRKTHIMVILAVVCLVPLAMASALILEL